MASQPKSFVTPEEYLALDDAAEYPSEYLDGVIVQIEAASINHAKLLVSFARCLADAAIKSDSRCTVLGTARVFIPATGLYAQPDLAVTCGREEVSNNSLLNPVLLAEILSPTTEDYDCGRKFKSYRSIPSLKEYITVAQDRIEINRWVRNSKWTLNDTYTEIDSMATILDWTIPVREIYRNIDF